MYRQPVGKSKSSENGKIIIENHKFVNSTYAILIAKSNEIKIGGLSTRSFVLLIELKGLLLSLDVPSV